VFIKAHYCPCQGPKPKRPTLHYDIIPFIHPRPLIPSVLRAGLCKKLNEIKNVALLTDSTFLPPFVSFGGNQCPERLPDATYVVNMCMLNDYKYYITVVYGLEV
jgi:hypothetical protein